MSVSHQYLPELSNEFYVMSFYKFSSCKKGKILKDPNRGRRKGKRLLMTIKINQKSPELKKKERRK